MDTLIIQGKFRKVVSIEELEFISEENSTRYNRNINWQMFRKDCPVEGRQCLVVPVLIHQNFKGDFVFPHLRCQILVDGSESLMLQDISFEQWFRMLG
jgi:hypothetical protein